MCVYTANIAVWHCIVANTAQCLVILDVPPLSHAALTVVLLLVHTVHCVIVSFSFWCYLASLLLSLLSTSFSSLSLSWSPPPLPPLPLLPPLCYRYWHRSLNPKKLVEVQFSSLHRHMTLQRMMRLYRLPDVGLFTCIRIIIVWLAWMLFSDCAPPHALKMETGHS